jgi:hypothetical protein
METRNDPNPSSNSLLPFLLAALLAAGISVLLIIATGAFFLYVLLSVLGIIGFGYLHYLLWGRSLSEEVEREKAAEEAKDRLDRGYSWKPEETRIREM